MPNARREGWQVSSYSAPAELIAAAQARAAAEGRNLSEVIRAALAAYVEEPIVLRPGTRVPIPQDPGR